MQKLELELTQVKLLNSLLSRLEISQEDILINEIVELESVILNFLLLNDTRIICKDSETLTYKQLVDHLLKVFGHSCYVKVSDIFYGEFILWMYLDEEGNLNFSRSGDLDITLDNLTLLEIHKIINIGK